MMNGANIRLKRSKKMDYVFSVIQSINLMIRQYDSEYKLGLAGLSGVGKSSIYNRFIYNVYDNNYAPTIGVAYQFRTLQLDSKRIRLEIWDTAGQEKFKSLASSYFRKCHAVVFIFDLSDKISFECITNFWYDQAIKIVGKETLGVLVGNKSDLPRKVDDDIRKQYCESKRMKYFQCSAKDNIGCQDIFTYIATTLEQKGKKEVEAEQKVQLKVKKQKKKCCESK